jgi:2-methylisocitrate lyase-like PEP mutase family enzyme
MPEGRFDDVQARASGYADAGADSLFVPGLLDLDMLSALTGVVSLPVNVMVGPGAPSVGTLQGVGVRRVSLGQAISQAAYSLARRAAVEALTCGTYDSLADTEDFGAINSSYASH